LAIQIYVELAPISPTMEGSAVETADTSKADSRFEMAREIMIA
jgi:hypothetical protein